MNRVTAICLALAIILIGSLFAFGVHLAELRSTERLMVINEVARKARVFGERPLVIGGREYRAHKPWVANSLVVYLNGIRLQKGSEYHINVRRRDTFTLRTFMQYPNANVIIDYTPEKKALNNDDA